MLLKEDGLFPLVSPPSSFPCFVSHRLHQQQAKPVQFLSPGIKRETSCCAKRVSWQFGELSWLTCGTRSQEGERRWDHQLPEEVGWYFVFCNQILSCVGWYTTHKHVFALYIFSIRKVVSNQMTVLVKWKGRACGRDLMPFWLDWG